VLDTDVMVAALRRDRAWQAGSAAFDEK